MKGSEWPLVKLGHSFLLMELMDSKKKVLLCIMSQLLLWRSICTSHLHKYIYLTDPEVLLQCRSGLGLPKFGV